jgi:hypothetical protein
MGARSAIFAMLANHLARGIFIILSLLRAPVVAPAQEQVDLSLTLSQLVEKLLEKNAERAKALENYSNKRVYQLDYHGFPSGFHAEMTVSMNYHAPDKKEFKILSESGPKWIVSRVLKRLIETEREAQEPENRSKVELNNLNYRFTSLEYNASPDGCSYIVSLEPKVPNKFLYRGRIWVNDKDFAVCRIEGEPALNPSMWISTTVIRHNYQKIGAFWLPAENVSISSLRLNGRARLSIKYSDYEVNKPAG